MEDADAVLVRSAAMHDMELPDKSAVHCTCRSRCQQHSAWINVQKQGIVVFNTPGANANGVKELVIAGMLLASRDIVGGIDWVQYEEDRRRYRKNWQRKQKKQFAGCETQRQKAWCHRSWCNRCSWLQTQQQHLGMEVYGYDPYISVDAAWKLSRDVQAHQRLWMRFTASVIISPSMYR